MLHKEQRCSPRGFDTNLIWHNLISLTLASKLKSFAWVSKPVSFWKMPSARDSTIFWFVENGPRSRPFFSLSWSTPETSRKFMKTSFFRRTSENLRLFWRRPFFRRLLTKLRPWPWPRESLSSGNWSLALVSDFFVSLALASTLVSSNLPLMKNYKEIKCEVKYNYISSNAWNA